MRRVLAESAWICSVIGRVIGLAACLGALPGCEQQPDPSPRVLAAMGFTQVHTREQNIFSAGCAESDDYATHFDAVGPTGSAVSGVVCRGWGKSATVRFE